MKLSWQQLVLVVAAPSIVYAATGDDAFRADVAPILSRRCLGCHNGIDRRGDVSLESASDVAGLVRPGQPSESALLSVVESGSGERPSMPKDGDPLNHEEVAAIRKWIRNGAKWPDGFRIQPPVVRDFDWWSLKPVRKPNVPLVGPEWANRIRTPIDNFIFEKLERQNLSPSIEADRRTLIRRVTFDLTGLPPTPEDVDSFLSDESPNAYRKLVDRLLSSDHYGERWARHWLDVVRYADTAGYDKDKLRPNAWPYRDYVVRAFNEDKPYSRFVEEQIAGDVLYPDTPDGILGLGFIAAGPWDFIGHVEVPESKADGKEARNLDRDEMVSATLNTFCSTTVQCARCHNHKFDPITQEHYYSLQSVFAAVDRADRVYDADPATESQRRVFVEKLAELRRFVNETNKTIRRAGGDDMGRLEKRIAELKSLSSVKSKRPEFGYHSAISESKDVEKWVQLNFDKPVELAEIVLHACHDDFGGIGAGFGFPETLSVSVESEDGEEVPVVTRASMPNPQLHPVRMRLAEPMVARSIRVTAHQLARRSNDYIFALAELRVLNSVGKNLAMGAKVTSADSIEAPVRWRRTNLVDGIWPIAGNLEAAAELAKRQVELSELLNRVRTRGTQEKLRQTNAAIARLESKLSKLPQGRKVYAAATQFAVEGNFKPTLGKPRAISVLHRGNVSQPGALVAPGTIPLKAGEQWRFALPAEHTEGERRAALAKWITAKENPLTWRSIVNRVWQYHFGRGLVETPNDFGRMGQQPTHPKLLDWLAAEFRDNSQSFRSLHRMIVMSAVYRQQSAHNTSNARIDSDNRFLWRMNRRRLEAEELRDAVLTVSGKLNRTMGGPGFYLFALEKTAHSPHYEYHKFDPTDPTTHRRSLYRFVVRSQPDPFMTTLDCADSSQSTPRRVETLTSLQALSLLNNRFMLAMAQSFANRLEAETDSPEAAIQRAMSLIANRRPTSDEANAFSEYVQQHGLANFCRLLFNLSEFMYVD